MTLNVAREFSPVPGPRLESEGPHSAVEFREKHLKPRFLEARERGDLLVVDLDGGFGYATSFLEEAFGGLARQFSADEVQQTIQIKSDDEPYLVADVDRYIREACTGAASRALV